MPREKIKFQGIGAMVLSPVRLFLLPIRPPCPSWYTDPIVVRERHGSSLLHRLIAWGEHKWTAYGAAPPRTLKSLVYRAGTWLTDRLSTEEEFYRRLYPLSLPKTLLPADPLRVVVVSETPLGDQDRMQLLYLLRDRAAAARRRHGFWWKCNACLLLPVTLLTVLPGVKLLLAWVAFRAVTRFRAWRGAAWLADRLVSHRVQLDRDPEMQGRLQFETDAQGRKWLTDVALRSIAQTLSQPAEAEQFMLRTKHQIQRRVGQT
jgi:hypothetical protein